MYANLLLAGDTQPAVEMLGDGTIRWGPGGTTAYDTRLYRSSAVVLKTDGGLIVSGQLSGKGSDIASATSITVTSPVHRVTGSTTIQTINGFADGARVTLIFQAACAINSLGNVWATPAGGTLTVAAHQAIDLVYDATATVWTVENAAPVAATPPGTELDYKQVVSNSVDVAAGGFQSEANPVIWITGNSVTYDGTKVKLEFFVPNVTSNGLTPIFFLVRDSTVLGQFKMSTTGQTGGFSASFFDTPSAGAHIYYVKVFASGPGNLTIQAGAGGSGVLLPSYLRVTKA